jgi:hypothetical protein
MLESYELPHAAFIEHKESLVRRIDDALDGAGPACEYLIGPSRVGKTSLISALSRAYPSERRNGTLFAPLLVVPVPSPVTPKEMPRSVLSALGISTARGNSADLFDRMRRLLEIAQTRVIAFEEASHIVEVGAKMPSRAAGDWFKLVLDRLGITIFLFGVPRLEKLFDSNEQLRRRSQARREFRPYDWADADGRRGFATCVRTYADMFASHGWHMDVEFEMLVRHCYLLSGGLIGVVSAFMSRLAYDIERQVPRALTFADCALSLSKVSAAGHPHCPAFVREAVTPVELGQAYAFVMEDAGMSLRRAR